MDLHNRLKELNNLPEDRALKARIYEGIHQNKRASLVRWKEAFLIIAISVISLFLVFVPESVPQSQTANIPIQAIYKNFGGKEGEFSARSSSLYFSVEKVEDQTVYTFFENFSPYVKESESSLGNYITDVIVIRNGQEERYQVSDTGMLHVDTGQFYVENSNLYGEVFNSLYSVTLNNWFMFFPLTMLAINLVSWAYYKRHHVKEVNLLKTYPWLFALIMIVVAIIFAWPALIGPLYKPLIIVLALLYGVVTWHVIKKTLPSYLVYKFEAIKLIISTAALVIFIILV